MKLYQTFSRALNDINVRNMILIYKKQNYSIFLSSRLKKVYNNEKG
jgi:hypothetical protein